MKNNTNYAVCNSDEPNQMLYPFENSCRVLAGRDRCFILNTFNACRESLSSNIFQARGGQEIEKQGIKDKNDPNPGSFMMITGCGPGKSVSANSTLLDVLFR